MSAAGAAPKLNILGAGVDAPPNNNGDNCFSAGGVAGAVSNLNLDGDTEAGAGDPNVKGAGLGASFMSFAGTGVEDDPNENGAGFGASLASVVDTGVEVELKVKGAGFAASLDSLDGPPNSDVGGSLDG